MGSILRAASCQLQAAKSQQGSSLTLWGRSCEVQAASCKLQSHQKVSTLLCGVDPASCDELRAASLRAAESRASHLWCRSCELRAASCKLQSHKKVEPRTCGVHPASCELQAASLRAAEKSSLGPVQNDDWQQLQRVGGGLPSLLGSGAEERGQAIEVAPPRRQVPRSIVAGRGGIEWVRHSSQPAAAHTRPTIGQYT